MNDESRFRELLEAAPDGIIEIDSEGRIVLLNAVVEELFGYTREELMGSSVDGLIPETLRPRHAMHRGHFIMRPQVRRMGHGLTLLARRKDGSEFPVEISLSPIVAEDGMHVTAVIRDVTEQKAAEEKIRAINQQLEIRNREVERANRLKSEFLASMSHELRTPLHTIIGFTELLKEEIEGPLNDKQRRFITHVHQDSLHLLELINDILDLSKIEAGKLELRPEVFDGARVVDEAVASIRPMAENRGLTLDNRLTQQVFILADKTRFREILNNLLSNAVKFTPNGGVVTVESSTEGELATFSITDTGVGISPEDHEAVFDKFRQVGSTTKGVREGTGLGLAIVKRLVEMHGGRITLRSAPGEGSTFSFSMPTGQAQARKEPLVLIIEDEPSGQELLSSYLQPNHLRTVCAGNAPEGIAKAKELHPDLITLDLLLPGQTGWQVLRELRQAPETSNIPIIVISVLDEDKVALELGAVAYLRKPLKKDLLLQEVKQHLNTRFGNI